MKKKYRRKSNLEKRKKLERRLSSELRRLFSENGKKVRPKFSNYQEYMLSEDWELVKKNHYAVKQNRVCSFCGLDKNLQVHHSSYRRLYTMHEARDLWTFCGKCHSLIHDIKNKNEKLSICEITKIMSNISSLEYLEYSIRVANLSAS